MRILELAAIKSATPSAALLIGLHKDEDYVI